MAQKDELGFDFGKLSDQDVSRVLQQIKDRKYEHFKLNEAEIQGLSQFAGMFVRFVHDTLTHLGLIDKAGVANPRVAISVEADPENNPGDMLKKLWNDRAKDWAVVESAATYGITFQTLLEHFRTQGPGRTETLLSLGCGPGLYETFLATLLQMTGSGSNMRIICLDSAKGMTKCQERILKDASVVVPGTRTLMRIKNIEPVTGDMLDLQFKDGSIDQIICNNSLQWTLDWRKAIAEMARVMNPKGLGLLYLFVHRHPMTVYKEDRSPVIQLGNFQLEELLDCLEENRFQIDHTRQIVAREGMGQMGSSINRVFIRAQRKPEGPFRHWRDAKIAAAVSAVQA